jgi:hypothetical protein
MLGNFAWDHDNLIKNKLKQIIKLNPKDFAHFL